MNFEKQLDSVLKEIREILLKKNADYGSSFAKQFEEYGLVSYLIRDDDKTRRLKNLIHNKNQVEESILDSVLDKAGYAILGLICLKEQEHTITPVQIPVIRLKEPFKPKINTNLTKNKHYCDSCGDEVGEIACSDGLGGSYCSTQCTDAGKFIKQHNALVPLAQKPPYADLDD